MSGKKSEGKKRKPEEDSGDVTVDKEKGKGSKKVKAEPKPKAPPKLKPFTPEQEEIAKGASMERNKAMADFLCSIKNQLKEQVCISCAPLVPRACHVYFFPSFL